MQSFTPFFVQLKISFFFTTKVAKHSFYSFIFSFLKMNLQQMLSGLPQPGVDTPVPDTAEQIYISSLALLKMLKHG